MAYTYYDAWLDKEKKKIHDSFETRREELLLAAMSAGFDAKPNTNPDIVNVSQELSGLDAKEKEMIGQFEKDPGRTTAMFMDYIMANKPK